jgi:HEPN domain-containing protein
MKNETLQWLKYAEENLRSARVLLDSNLYNPCLQNAQQAVEKMLKAVLVERGIKFKKTHSIDELTQLLNKNKITIDLPIEDRELLDSIYLPSKYPLGSVLPDFEPDEKICRRCIEIVEKMESSAAQILG